MLSVVVLLGLLQRERLAREPLIPKSFLRARAFRAALATASCMTFGMYAFLFAAPLAAQRQLHVSALASGLALVPSGAAFVVLAPFATRIASAVGVRRAIACGLGTIGGGLLLAPLMTATGALEWLAVASFLTGIGMGLATGPIMALGLGRVSTERSGMASALLNTARLIGATLGVAVLGGATVAPALSIAAAVEILGAGCAYAFARG